MELSIDSTVASIGATVSKVCFKCNAEKPLTDYYKHPKMGDGHLGKCKACTKSDTKKRAVELADDPEWVEKEQARHRDKYHRLGYRELHKTTPEQKAEDMARYIARYPEKHIARGMTAKIKPVVAGNQMHHWCYAPLYANDLIELSVADHYTAHRFIEYDQSCMMYRQKGTGLLLDSREAHECFIKGVLWAEQNRAA